jgi:hypothetical protein
VLYVERDFRVSVLDFDNRFSFRLGQQQGSFEIDLGRAAVPLEVYCLKGPLHYGHSINGNAVVGLVLLPEDRKTQCA